MPARSRGHRSAGRAHAAASGQGIRSRDLWAVVNPSTQYTISWYMKKVQATGTGTLYIRWYTSGYTFISSSTVYFDSGTHDWKRYVTTATSPATAGLLMLLFSTDGATAGTPWEVYYDAIQVEAKAYMTPYCDGSLGSGHTWSGPAPGSPSSRAAATFTYPTVDNIEPTAGTIACWLFTDAATSADQVLFRLVGTSAGSLLLSRLNATGCLRGQWGTSAVDGSTALTVGAWHHCAMTYSGTTLTLYLDGMQTGQGASSGFSGLPTTMEIGESYASVHCNGLIDDLVILPRALSAAEVKALYDCGMPASPGAVSTRDEWQPAVRYKTDAGQSISNATMTIVNFEDQVYDNCGWVVTGANWRFTARTPGVYHVDARLLFAISTAWATGEGATICVYVNGALYTSLEGEAMMNSGSVAQYKTVGGSADVGLALGDYVDIRIYQASGGALALQADASWNWVSIHRVPS